MGRLSREDLKVLVKECLIEIMAEGLGPAATSLSEGKRQGGNLARVASQVSRQHSRIPRADPRPAAASPKTSERYDRQVSAAVSSLTSDPVMRQILESTARTTVREQVAADTAPGLGSTSSGPSVPLDNLLPDEGTDRWAALAFAPPAGPGRDRT